MKQAAGFPKPSREGQQGFALLLVFVMAAAIAISFYMALPRTTFEAQRRKEQLLVDRGQEYVTAIRRYYRKFQRFPAKLEDLENTNNMRFLRKRYVDPMTGKADWRLIHAGPGGILLDSLVQKPGGLNGAPGQNPNQPGAQQGQNFVAQNGFNTTGSDGSAPSGEAAIPGSANPGLMRRPSDRTPGAGAQPVSTDQDGNPIEDPNGAFDPQQAMLPPGSDVQPPGTPGYPGQPVSNPGFPPQTNPGQVNPGQMNPGQFNPGQINPGQVNPGQITPGQINPATGQPGVPSQLGQNPFGNNQPPGTPGAPQFPPGGATFQSGAYQQPGMPGSGAAAFNPALQQIQGQLTNPGSNGNSPFGTNNSPFGGGQSTGGIVGVASKLAQRGIMEFDKHHKYSEWEFIFDMKKLNGLPGQAVQFQNVPGMNGVNNPNGQNTTNSPFSQSNQQPSPTPSSSPQQNPFPGAPPQMPPTTISPDSSGPND